MIKFHWNSLLIVFIILLLVHSPMDSYSNSIFLYTSDYSTSSDSVTLKTFRKQIEINQKLKAQLQYILDSLSSRAKFEDALVRQKESQKEDKEKQFLLQNLSLQEKAIELIKERDKRRNLVLTGIAFLIISLLTIIYLYFRHRNLLNNKTHLAEITLQQEKELKQHTLIDLITARIEAQEEERERISRELHDGIGGNMVAIRLLLQSLDNENPTVEELQKLVGLTHQEIRAISHNLASPRLDETPFEQLFYHHIGQINSQKGQSVEGILLPKAGWCDMEIKLQTELFRLIQEVTGNIIKHSKATKVTLTLRRDSSSISLIAEDNGIGFTPNKGNEGIGLQNIKNRVLSLNGNFDISPNPGKGTVIIIEIPNNI